MVENAAASHSSIVWRQGPIEPSAKPVIASVGAILTFHGIVRPYEDRRLLEGLTYTHYEPMATLQLQRLADRVIQTHRLDYAEIIHSLGFVPINQVSLQIILASKHRKASLLAMDEILEDLKRDVPIWKTPIFTDNPE